MKKNYLLASLLLIMFSANAQNPALPNPGFEFWTQISGSRWDPDNWNTLNPSTAIIGVLTATRATGADVHSGSYAIKLQTKNVFGQIANGIATTGTLITTPPYGVKGGIPYTQRPDSITGWYKYTPAGTDSGFVEFILKGHNNDSVGYVRFVTPNAIVSTYTRFAAKINYYSSANPDTAVWILSSSRGSGPVVNSAIIIDDLNLVFNPIVCNVPGGPNTIQITSNSAKMKYGAVAGAILYQQKYRVFGTTTWIYKTSTTLGKALTGLSANTKYEWAVRAKCSINPLVWSGWSPKETFTTLTVREEPVVIEDTDLHELSIYPNPASELLNLNISIDQDREITIKIFNAIGQQIMQKKVMVDDGMLNEQLDISKLHSGIYMVAVSAPGFHQTKKLLVR